MRCAALCRSFRYSKEYLSQIPELSRQSPWAARHNSTFGAGTAYHRNQDLRANLRVFEHSLTSGGGVAWPHAQPTKLQGGPKSEVMVRAGLSHYITTQLRDASITYSFDGVPLRDWAAHKAVLHVDGITCSSKLWQLLALGSVVLREQSGYEAFYDKLLTKWVHYIPFWRHRPREVVAAHAWVAANDAEAASIAKRGQAFAAELLNKASLDCFWVMLLQQYARLLRFTPGQRQGAVLIPIDAWLAAQEKAHTDWPDNFVRDMGARLEYTDPMQ